MLTELALSVSIGALACSAWYFICVRANRRKALRVLRWMEVALALPSHRSRRDRTAQLSR